MLRQCDDEAKRVELIKYALYVCAHASFESRNAGIWSRSCESAVDILTTDECYYYYATDAADVFMHYIECVHNNYYIDIY